MKAEVLVSELLMTMTNDKHFFTELRNSFVRGALAVLECSVVTFLCRPAMREGNYDIKMSFLNPVRMGSS